MKNIVSIERLFSALALFIATKSFWLWIAIAIVVTSAGVLAFLINQSISPRMVVFFETAFNLSANIANRFSIGLAVSISILAYTVLAAIGMGKTIGYVEVIEDNQIKTVPVEIGEYDSIILAIVIALIEIVAIATMPFKDAEIVGGVLMLQILISVLLKATLPRVKHANDIASKNIETESELAHKLASESAKAALQGEEKPNGQAPEKPKTQAPKTQTKTVNLGGTEFEIKQSKLA